VLKGVKWNIGIKREEIIDYKTCDKNRNLENGSRFSCGFCMVSCPFGIEK
jgi:heterodisulfide reductase subunit C